MNRKILCVDDDPNILSGFKRNLRKDFEIYTAEGGAQALDCIKEESEFAVIVSDMQMPVMNGVQFFEQAKRLAPNSIRVMLTGNADQQTAVNAINNGNIFRFLTKPCEIENLAQVLNAGINQYHLITAEKQLLNGTLGNSLQVMVEILSMVNPIAFSRSNRIKRMARNMAERCEIKNLWAVEMGAMLSQIGCITLDQETLQKISRGEPLDEKQLQLYHQHPQVAHSLISRIPRMEIVAEIIVHQNRRLIDESEESRQKMPVDETTLGSRILKIVLDFDKLLDAGNLPHHALKELSTRIGWYDQNTFKALKALIDESSEEFVSAEVNIHELKPGMLLDKPVVSTRGALLLSAGQEVTLPLILKLINFAETGLIKEDVRVSIPIGIFQMKEQEQEVSNITPAQRMPNLAENPALSI